MSIVAILPVGERIAVELFERLRLLTAGFSATTPVSEVIRPTRFDAFTPKHLQIVLTEGSKERATELDCFGNPPAIAWVQTFNIRCHVIPSEKDPTPLEQYATTMSSDVMRVVCTSTSQWHTFGGLAIDAQWGNPEPVAADGGIDGVNIPIDVTYRTDETNPFNVRS